MNIYVGNLSRETTEDDLRNVFKEYGEVASVNIIKDRYTDESRGFGFVEMPERDDALKAIDGLNGADLDGRTLNVNEARPRADRGGAPRRTGGGGGRRRF